MADPGERPAPPPLFFDQNKAQRAEKVFWRPGVPLISGSGWPPPLPPLSEGMDPPLLVIIFFLFRVRAGKKNWDCGIYFDNHSMLSYRASSCHTSVALSNLSCFPNALLKYSSPIKWACKQALGTLEVGQEKEGELATMSLIYADWWTTLQTFTSVKPIYPGQIHLRFCFTYR